MGLPPPPKATSGHLTRSQRFKRSAHAHRQTFATVAMSAIGFRG